MYQNITKLVWEFLEKHGISPWYFVIVIYIFACYMQVPIIRNWANSSSLEKYRVILFFIGSVIALVVFLLYFLETT